MTEPHVRTLRTVELGGALELSDEDREEATKTISRGRYASTDEEARTLDVDTFATKWASSLTFNNSALRSHATFDARERGEPVAQDAWRRALTQHAIFRGFAKYYTCTGSVELAPEAFDFWLEVAAAAATTDSSGHDLEALIDLERWRAEEVPATDRGANLAAVLGALADWSREHAERGHPNGLCFVSSANPSHFINECERHVGLGELIRVAARAWDDERFVWWVIASLKRDVDWETYVARREAADAWMAHTGASKDVARALSTTCQLRIAAHLLDEELTRGFLDAGVQVPIWHIVHALRDAPRADVVDAVAATYTAAPARSSGWGTNDYSDIGYPSMGRPSETAIALHLGVDAPGLIEHFIARDLKSGTCQLTPRLVKMSSPLLIEHFYWILGRKKLRRLWPGVEDHIEWEGANAIAGLVGMAERRGKRRAFALEHLQSYARRGHAALIEDALTRATEPLAELVRKEVLSAESRADASARTATGNVSFQVAAANGKTLDPAEAPEWLADVLALPAAHVSDPRLEHIVWPAVRLAGSGLLLTPDTLSRISAVFRAVNTSTHDQANRPVALDEAQRADARRAKEALGALRDAILPVDADALWCDLFHHAPSQWSMWSLKFLGGPRAFERAGQLLRRDSHAEPSDVGFAFISAMLRQRDDPRAWAHVLSVERLGRKKKDDWMGYTVRDIYQDLEERHGWSVRRADANLAPPFGLEADGAARFDYGGRVVTLRVDASLQVIVSDDTGKVHASLPGARKGEDRARVALHKKRMKWMRGILGRAIEEAKERFEDELCDTFSRSLGELREHVLSHPWKQFFVRSLIWGSYDGLELEHTFLCDADGSLMGADFGTLELPDDAIVRLVHPSELTDDARRAWSQVLADSEILQPFAQLQREVFTAQDWASENDRFGASSLGAKEATSKRLRDQPRWEQIPTRHSTRYGSIWFAQRRFDALGLCARLLFDERQWDFPVEGELERTPGLYVFRSASAKDPTDFSRVMLVDPSELPPRVTSELLLELRG